MTEWKEIADLVQEAASLPDSACLALLRERCGRREHLRHEVECILAERGKFEAIRRGQSVGDPTSRLASSGRHQDRLALSQLFNFEPRAPGIGDAEWPHPLQLPRTGDWPPQADAGALLEQPNPIGTFLGRYFIKRWLGAGGMADVYLVHDTVLGRELALKRRRFRPTQQTAETPMPGRSRPAKSDEGRLRFRQEFACMSKLIHPNIPKVYDFGTLEDGSDYFTMEVVAGSGLHETLCRQRPDLSTVCHLLIQLCHALDFLHSRSLVHRDLKPENLRVSSRGELMVMDFGLIEPMGYRASRISGTMAYLCPEVIQGKPVDARSDLYSMGVIAYEMVAGCLPFVGGKAEEILEAHLHRAAAPLPLRQQNVPEAMERLILRLLEKSPDERYQEAAAVSRDLGRLIGASEAEASLANKKSYLYCAGLIGRNEEFGALTAALKQLKNGAGNCTFITAPAGVGKSRLLQEFRLRAQLMKVPFLLGQCRSQSGGSFEPFTGLLKGLLALTPAHRAASFEAVVHLLLPEALDSPTRPVATALTSLDDKAHVFGQVAEWIQEVANHHSLVLCLEDLHWADAGTLELFQWVVTATRSAPVFYLGTFRQDELAVGIPLLSLVREQDASLLALQPLSREQVPRLIKGMLGRAQLSEGFTGQLYTATMGNAFFLSEILRKLIEDGALRLEDGCWLISASHADAALPSSIEETILHRLQFLSPPAHELLSALAIAGRGLGIEALRDISSLEDEALFDSLGQLLERQFLQKAGDEYALAHDRVRETVYARLSAERRSRGHLRMAELLERQTHGNSGVPLAELAFHYSQTDRYTEAIHYLVQAGKDACRRQVPLAGLRALDQALRLLDQHDYADKKWVILDCLETITQYGLLIDNRVCAEAAERLASAARSMTHLASMRALFRAFFRCLNCLPPRLNQSIQRRLNRPPPPYPVGAEKWRQWVARHNYPMNYARYLGARSVLAACVPCSIGLTRMEVLIQENLNEIPDNHSLLSAFLSLPHLMLLNVQGRTAHDLEAARILEIFRKNELFLDAQQRKGHAFVINLVLARYAHHGDKKFTADLFETWGQMIERHEFHQSRPMFHWLLAYFALVHGDLRTLRKQRELCGHHINRLGKPTLYQLYLYHLDIRSCLMLAHYQEASRLCEIWKLMAANNQDVPTEQLNRSWILLFSGQARLGLGESEPAINEIRAALTLATEYDLESTLGCTEGLARALFQLGRWSEAETLAQACYTRAHSPDWANPYWQILSARLLGELRLKQNRFEEAGRYLHESWKKACRMDNPLQSGLGCLILAEWNLAQGHAAAAEALAGSALEQFEQLEFQHLIEMAQSSVQTIRRDTPK